MKPWVPGRAWTTVLALIAVGGAPGAMGPVSAQERARADDCRCVDRDGNPIENCHCLRTPRVVVATPFPSRGARMGISLDSEQSQADDAVGARITSVMEDGPAERAGLRTGDVVTRVDGHSLLQPLDGNTERGFDLDRSIPVQRLIALARELEPGAEVEVEYRRDGEPRTATLEARDLSPWGVRVLGPDWDADAMAERMRDLSDRIRDRALIYEGPGGARGFQLENAPESGAFRFRSGDPGVSGFLWRMGGEGLELTEMKPGLASYFGTDHGVLVTEVDESSELGLEPGDVILSIHGRDVDTPSQVRRILASYGENETVSFRIMRQKQERTVEGTLSR
jgi:membrane-associated protease RseP (regulator of RpoE activity)